MNYDLMYKSATKATWDAFTLASGLTVDEDGVVSPSQNVLIDEIGPIVITPAVVDDAWHVNVRLLGDSFDIPALAAGDEDTEWINPADVTAPARIWACGMNYWLPEEPAP